MFWNERKKLKYCDSNNAKETKTKNLWEIFSNYFFYHLRKIP